MSSPSTTSDQARVSVVYPTSARCDAVDVAANLVVFLACSDRRVLVIDWSNETWAFNDYLEPFAQLTKRCPEDLWVPVAALSDEPSAPIGEIRHYNLRGRVPGMIEMIAAQRSDRTPAIAPDHASPNAVSALRGRVRKAEWDDVVVILPSSGDEILARLASTLGDTVIVAFGPSEPAVAEAAEASATIRLSAHITVDILPVLTRVSDNPDLPLVSQVRSTAGQMFAVLLAEQADRIPLRQCVELPLSPYVDTAPILSIVSEPPEHSLWRRYEELATCVAGTELHVGTPLSPAMRHGYRRLRTLDPVTDLHTVVITGTPGTEQWVAWARTQIARAGGSVVESVEHTDPATSSVLVLHTDDDPVDLGSDVDGGPARLSMTVPEADDFVDATPWESPEAAVEAFRVGMLTDLGFLREPGSGQGRPIRPPWAPPTFCRLPAAPEILNLDDPDLRALRAELVVPTRQRTIAHIEGDSGTGKTALVRAYAAHFGWDYEGVWWLPAGDRRTLLRYVASLSRALEPKDDVAGAYGSTAALARLASPGRGRFLLVYDDCEDLDQLAADGLLPDALTDVHVLVTSRKGPSTTVPDARFRLGPLHPEQAAARLMARTPELTVESAADLAERLRHWPLAISLAGTWLRERAEEIRRRGGSVVQAAGSAYRVLSAVLDDATGPTSAHTMVSLVLATLRSEAVDEQTGDDGIGGLSVLLAECFLALSPNGAHLEFIRSRVLSEAIAKLEPRARGLSFDSIDVDRALRLGERFGLFQVDWGRVGLVRLDHAIQPVLADLTDAERRRAVNALVLGSLAQFAPVESAPPHTRHRLRYLFDHVDASGALTSGLPQVRRWLVNQVRYLYDMGNMAVWAETVTYGENLLAGWTAAHPADDPLRLRLMTQLANLRRALGDREDAKRLDEEALAFQRRLNRVDNPQTLFTARGLGGDQRGLGDYLNALAEDQLTWDGHVRELGEDHPETRKAANNLAVSLYLAGDTRAALARELDNHRRRVQLFGKDDPETVWSAVRVAIYQRDLGVGDPLPHLRKLILDFEQHPGRKRLLHVLQWQRSMALRDEHKFPSARSHIADALAGLRELLPPDHPDVLAAMLTDASIQRRSGNDPGYAVDMTRKALAGIDRRQLPAAHPIRALAGLGLGLATAGNGAPGAGRRLVADAHRSLVRRLDITHPWSIAATIDLAVLTASAGDLGEARDMTEEALDIIMETFGEGRRPDHPYAAVAIHNLTRAQTYERSGWREIDVDIPHT